MDNIEIRRAVPDDAAEFCRLFAHPLVFPGTLQLPYSSVEAWRERLSRSDASVVLVAQRDKQLLGNGAVIPESNPRRMHAASLGISVHGEWQGKGIGSLLMKALVDLSDNWLNITRLELTVFSDNQPAIGLYKKFGFEAEGTLRSYALRHGIFADVLTMARLYLRPASGSRQ